MTEEFAIVRNGRDKDESYEEEEDHTHHEPIISLPEVQVPTLEEDEEELFKIRAKLFRFDSSEAPGEWKERGTGDVKLLRHKTRNTVRVVMRRDKTLKICANHFVTPFMELQPNCGSDRAWVWSVLADFADETAKSELLAIRFANAENAKKWKEHFEEAKSIVANQCEIYTKSYDDKFQTKEEDEEEEEEDEAEGEEDGTSSDENNETNNKKEADSSFKQVTSELDKMSLSSTLTNNLNQSGGAIKEMNKEDSSK
ncbi:ran-specific GTPase-activating protein [Nilaparvata lugens]|uniref:ran-specific GTPase-activating protein n=1 Tax=Nilaparvata lugens TaxID=108931 RepID=UPI00193D7AFB|nr:ran-specific GTPase-activating protein [Nilaparvata lugens]